VSPPQLTAPHKVFHAIVKRFTVAQRVTPFFSYDIDSLKC
jgi:hypothetical protein